MKKLMLFFGLALTGTLASAESLAPLGEFTLNDGRTVIVDENQRTVYTFDVDNGSTSNCYEACATAWPPVLIADSVQVSAPLGKTSRRDGSVQLTFDGKPIYYFVSDAQAGDIKGDGLSGVWHIIVK